MSVGANTARRGRPGGLRHMVALLLLAGCTPGDKFDSAKWKGADLTTRARADMVDALIRQHPLAGMHRNDVVRLLGEPTRTDKWEGWDMIYVLGPASYTSVDHAWLVIKLGADGRVSDYRITAD